MSPLARLQGGLAEMVGEQLQVRGEAVAGVGGDVDPSGPRQARVLSDSR
jgi:hypothetical protein